MTEPLTDNSKMPFGKYAGEKLANVPASYLVWLYRVSYNNSCGHGAKPLQRYIHENIDVLRQQEKQENTKGKIV